MEGDSLTLWRIQYQRTRQGKCPKVPPGSIKTVACVKRSVKMNRFPKFGTLNSGDPESVPAEAERRPRANGDQPQEDAIWTFRESDLPIVVRDGNTGHTASHRYAGASTAKERAGRQRKQSTHFQDTITPGKSVKLPTCIGNPLRPECRGWFHLRVFLRSPVR